MPELQAIKDFAFIDLSTLAVAELDAVSRMDGMAAGTFISMWGDEVTFLPEELSTYIKNTQRVLNSTKDSNGNVVGLPIDQDAHDHAGGAGWIVGMELDESRGVIIFLVNWTDIGRDLIRNNIRRFFSPSVDIVNKVILGGSLTNYPASRNEKGQILLRPIELSQSIKELDMPNILEQLKTLLDEARGSSANPPATPPTPATPPPAAPAQSENLSTDEISPELRKFLQSPEGTLELGELATKIAAQKILDEKRKMHTVEFAARMVGGTKEKPFGLKVPAKRLVAVLLSLPEAQAREVEKLIEMCLDSAIDFAEHGFDSEGYSGRPELPEEVKKYARQWVKDGGNIKEFFAANPEIGKMEEFNLAEFVKAKE